MSAVPAVSHAYRTGAAPSRLRRKVVLVVFLGALLVVSCVAVLVIVLRDGGGPTPGCSPGRFCPPPEVPPRLAARVLWKSPGLGFALEYDPEAWKVAEEDEAGITLAYRGFATLTVRGAPGPDPALLLEDQLSLLREKLPDLAPNRDERMLLGPSVGYVDGPGGAYCGTSTAPSGATARVDVLAMAASDGGTSLLASALSPDCDKAARGSAFLQAADAVLNTIVFPAGPGAPSADDAAVPPKAEPPRADVALGPSDPGRTIDFTLLLRLPGEAALERFLASVTDPSSPAYRHYLPSAADFGERFGVAAPELAELQSELAALGIAVTETYPQRTAVEARGRLGDVSRLFAVSFADYIDAAGRRFHAPLGEPLVPAGLVDSVVGVAGLSTRPLLEPLAVPAGGLVPADAARAYELTSLRGLGLDGSGQTVAVVSFASFADSDVAAFDQAVGLENAAPIERVPIEGGNEDVTSAIAREVSLDIQVIRGVAPRARILNYELPYGGAYESFTRGVGTAIDRIVEDGRADVVSISYGICDMQQTAGGIAQLPAADRARAERALAAAVAQGISVFVASGDQGAYACQRFDQTDLRPTTSWPGDSPSVVSVGGTLLSLREDGSRFDEAGWEDVLATWAGGGGLNPQDDRPAWQQGPGVDNEHSNGKRQVPDVAAAADPDSGFLVAFNGRQHVIGGTSAAAPFWAGLTALIAQYAEREGAGRVGFVAPILYELAATAQPFPAFFDVTRGGNRLHNATAGWDFSTGLGTPRAFNLARDVVAYLRIR